MSFSDIRFIKPDGDGKNLDDSGNQLTHAKTISYDVNSEGYAIVVYQDITGAFRIRASNGTTMFGGESPIADSSSEFAEIHFVTDDKAFLVDTTNDKVTMVHLDVTSQTVTLGENIAVGDNPSAITFNSDKSRAYVLNKNSENISVINLKNEDGSVRSHPQVVATNNLKDLIEGKTLTFLPNVITRTNDTLVIGSENLKALLLLKTSDITETELTDEDNDGDGFTGNGGDCDDNNALLNPNTIWYWDEDVDGYGKAGPTLTQCTQPAGYTGRYGDCKDRNVSIYPGAPELCDGRDNDCDGSVDEDVVLVTWYRDRDGDGYGDVGSSTASCNQPVGFVSDDSDCNDGESEINSAATELCLDMIDNDCDGVADDGCEGEVANLLRL